MGASMRIAIQQTNRVHCLLRDMWRCLVGKEITSSHAVLVTFEEGDRILLSPDQLDAQTLHLHPRSAQRLAQWQLLMLPFGDGPETESGGLMELVRHRDKLMNQIADLPARQSARANKLRGELSAIEARLNSLPVDVFEQFQRVDAVLSKMDRVKYALEQYSDKNNWNPASDGTPVWMWAGIGTSMERIDEPWGLADDALGGD